MSANSESVALRPAPVPGAQKSKKKRGLREKFSWTPYGLSLPLVIFAAAFFLYPIIRMVITTLITTDPATGATTFSWSSFQEVFQDSFALQIIFRTLRISLVTTVVTLVLAYPVTLWMRQLSSRARGILVVLFLSPLLMSVIVRSLGWVVFLGPGGLVDNLFSKFGLPPLKFLYTEPAIVLGLAQVFLGFMILSLLTSVLAIPDNVIAAAYNLGANSWQVLWRIVIPMTRPGVLAGIAIVFPLSASAYVTPALLGGSSNPVMATQIYMQAVTQLQFGKASALSVVLFIIVCIVIGVLGLFTSSRKRSL